MELNYDTLSHAKKFRVSELCPHSISAYNIPVQMPFPLYDGLARYLINECERPELVGCRVVRVNGEWMRKPEITYSYWLPPTVEQHTVLEVTKYCETGPVSDYYQVPYTNIVPLMVEFITRSCEQDLDERFILLEINNDQLKEWLSEERIDLYDNETKRQLSQLGLSDDMDCYSVSVQDF